MDEQRIIIFGGKEYFIAFSFEPQDSLYVLNLMNFEWYIPKNTGKIPSSRYWHQANVIGKCMVISFGKYIEKIFVLKFTNMTKFL